MPDFNEKLLTIIKGLFNYIADIWKQFWGFHVSQADVPNLVLRQMRVLAYKLIALFYIY